MTYYIISHRNCKKEVIRTSSNIAYARKIIAEEIEMDMLISKFTDGYTISSEHKDWEYHGVRLTDDSPYVLWFARGAKRKPDIAQAISDYKKREACRNANNN